MNNMKERNSNLELFRIITMFFIVAHHYVVNSGLTSQDVIFSNPTSAKSIFLLLFGAWGKSGINCFVLFSGYFMCKSKITLKKFLKIFLEWKFYSIIIYLIFLSTGYVNFDIEDLLKIVIPVYTISSNFTSCYILFFLSIPFINILVNSMNEKQHIYLLVWCFFTYIILGTIPKFSITINYVSWFIILYLISSYIRLYPKRIFVNTKLWAIVSIIFILLSAISVVACDFIFNGENVYCFVSDSNTFFAVGVGISLFLFFKNIKIKNSKIINKIASTTFGILCIHASSDAMRQWLWKDTLNNVGAYYSNYTIVHAIGSVLGVCIICSSIDLIRQKYIEKKFFIWFETKGEMVIDKYKKIEAKVAAFCSRLLNNK